MRRRLQIADSQQSGSSQIYPPNNEIWYTSTDGKIVIPYASDVFGANITSNTYENDKGVISFDGDVTEIGDGAFYDCWSLDTIIIPKTVTEIGNSAFAYCLFLIDIAIPNSVTKIGRCVFEDCYYLTSITIPESVIEIGEAAFFYCSSLASVYCKPKTPPSIYEQTFADIWDFKIYIPRGSGYAYATDAYWSKYDDDGVLEEYDF